MGIDYTAGLTYGTFAKDGSTAARTIEGMLEESGDSKVEIDGGVSLTRVGNGLAGRYFFGIETGSVSFTSRGGGYGSLVDVPPSDRAMILAAIGALGFSELDFEPIGYRATLDVW